MSSLCRSGLFVGPNGRRYERFKALPKLTKKLLGAKINVTDWRKIIATASHEYLSPDEISVMNLADTHSKETADRYYAKRNIKQNASKAVALTKSLYERMGGQTAAPGANTALSAVSAVPAFAPSATATVPVLDPSRVLSMFARIRSPQTPTAAGANRADAGMDYML
jgi:hypothetical protein